MSSGDPADPTFQAFELDVLAYRFDGGHERSLVVESKGGQNHFSALWKLLGLKVHLDIDQGVLLADPRDTSYGAMVNAGAEHEIAVIDQDADYLAENLERVGAIATQPDEAVLAAWVRAYRVEDSFIKTLMDKDLWQEYETIKLAKQQLQHLITKGWMEPDPWRQAFRLYRRFQEEPKIARRMAVEINGNGWGFLFEEALYRGASPEVQGCFYLEHRKRIAVAFAATRCAALDDETSRFAAFAPHSFREMVERIADEEAWYLPSVLQTYLLGFGGTICLDEPDAEFERLARQAGCTPEEASRALELFEELFPTPGGWFYDNFELSRLKLVPHPLRGVGIWMREAVYEGDWDDLVTNDQRRVMGSNEVASAARAEKLVLPRQRRIGRRRRQA